MSDVYALVRSIRNRSFSRNRHFDEHATASGARARRVNRFLIAVERDVLTAEIVTVERAENGGYRLTLRFPSVRMSRMVVLREAEHAILVEDPRVAARLASS